MLETLKFYLTCQSISGCDWLQCLLFLFHSSAREKSAVSHWVGIRTNCTEMFQLAAVNTSSLSFATESFAKSGEHTPQMRRVMSLGWICDVKAWMEWCLRDCYFCNCHPIVTGKKKKKDSPDTNCLVHIWEGFVTHWIQILDLRPLFGCSVRSSGQVAIEVVKAGTQCKIYFRDVLHVNGLRMIIWSCKV